jgi:hypothetical protein
MSPNRNLLVVAAALALAACAPEFDPASEVQGLRLLAIRAEPPEIAPPGDPEAAHTALLSSLVLRPEWVTTTAPPVTILYLACTPVPGEPTPSPCVMLAELRDPTAALAEAARASCDPEPPVTTDPRRPPPVAFAGAEVCDRSGCGPVALPGGGALPPPALGLPERYGELFAALPEGAPERILGVEAQVLAFAIDATVERLVEGADPACPLAAVSANLQAAWAVEEHVLAVKRVQIRGPLAADDPDVNPTLPRIQAYGADLDPLPAATTLGGGAIPLVPLAAPDSDLQLYTELDVQGLPVASAREELVYSWFSTAGELEELHTRGAEPQEWRASAARALVALVVRDDRGGVAWAVHDVDVSAEAPGNGGPGWP